MLFENLTRWPLSRQAAECAAGSWDCPYATSAVAAQPPDRVAPNQMVMFGTTSTTRFLMGDSGVDGVCQYGCTGE